MCLAATEQFVPFRFFVARMQFVSVESTCFFEQFPHRSEAKLPSEGSNVFACNRALMHVAVKHYLQEERLGIDDTDQRKRSLCDSVAPAIFLGAHGQTFPCRLDLALESWKILLILRNPKVPVLLVYVFNEF